MSLGHLNLSNFSSVQTLQKTYYARTSVYDNACVCKLLFEPVDLPLEVETHSTHYQNDTAKYFCQGHGGAGSWGS